MNQGILFLSFISVLAITAIALMLAKRRRKTDKNELERIAVYAPADGRVMALNEVSDTAFGSGELGEGAAIISETDTIFSPVCGIVSGIVHTGQAIALTDDCGAEILIHIGIETAALDGRFFEPLTDEGDRVCIGEPLIRVNMDGIKKEGFETPVIVTVMNSSKFEEVKTVCTIANGGEKFLEIIRKTEGRMH